MLCLLTNASTHAIAKGRGRVLTFLTYPMMMSFTKSAAHLSLLGCLGGTARRPWRRTRSRSARTWQWGITLTRQPAFWKGLLLQTATTWNGQTPGVTEGANKRTSHADTSGLQTGAQTDSTVTTCRLSSYIACMLCQANFLSNIRNSYHQWPDLMTPIAQRVTLSQQGDWFHIQPTGGSS